MVVANNRGGRTNKSIVVEYELDVQAKACLIEPNPVEKDIFATSKESVAGSGQAQQGFRRRPANLVFWKRIKTRPRPYSKQ